MTPTALPARHNLPSPPSPFIGRRREIAAVKGLLAGHRLLTLTGPGGCGKTRLAIQVGSELRDEYTGGVCLVELAPLADPALLPQAVAAALGIREDALHAGTLTSLITQQLCARQALLLLDNCEHLIEACAEFCAALLQACPDIRLLATSREVLRISGEAVWSVPPLSLPEPQPWRSPTLARQSLEAYQQSEAVQLFAARAAAASTSFALDEHTAPWVAEICRRLDGLPLAIELAAARCRAFSVRQIAERLDDRSALLRSGPRTAVPRQQTLDAALDWSYDLLPAQEQDVLRRLSVFAGGWTLEAAEAVCSTAAGPSTMQVLANLVDKSLVVVEHHLGEARYHLLETIRAYALHKLEEAGEKAEAQDRHLHYFVQFCQPGYYALSGPDQALWLARYTAEHDNLRAGLEWALTSPARVQAGFSLAWGSGPFWRLSGYLSEGRARLEAALRSPGAQDPSEGRARTLLWAAQLAYLQSDFPAAQALLEDALALCRSLGPVAREGLARALCLLGEVGTETGDYSRVTDYFEEALTIFRDMGNRQGEADMLMQLAWSAMRTGDYARASDLFSQCLPLFQGLDNTDKLGFVISGQGELAIRQGQYEQAGALLEASLALRTRLGQPWAIAASQGSLGWLALLQRDYPRMRRLMGESIRLRLELGERSGLAWCLEKLAEAVCQQAEHLPRHSRREEYQRAARVMGSAAALRRSVQAAIDPADEPAYERRLAELRAALGEALLEAAWMEGEAAPLASVIAQALAEPPLAGEALSEEQAAKAHFSGLSRREREAAALIAQGKTNAEIAALMFVRPRTAETYVTRILNKLGFTSRVQIAAWAHEAGLLHPESEKR